MYPNVSLYIDGAWSPGASGKSQPVMNPATGEQIGNNWAMTEEGATP